jgi:catechol 2,3-dioxygenase-like lactoylglutathione lyase family enzyme
MPDDEAFDLPTVPAAAGDLPGSLELGAFSVSLVVADLEVSRAFYEKLGFEVAGGDAEADYLILKNGETTLGLFHGMFDQNILTFNPGLTNRMERVETYTDVREVQQALEEAGLELGDRADTDSAGPASITVVDPDGNPILIDQFF